MKPGANTLKKAEEQDVEQLEEKMKKLKTAKRKKKKKSAINSWQSGLYGNR